ncbi:AbiH family protein [Tenacibaculum discolor]|uniref:AbiH family protein n=1 Tax=Tenacibaculum discolor TaxID=361581 RepID=UPI001F2FD183|nr:AbiH family protein [Tenacibaculum discolor]
MVFYSQNHVARACLFLFLNKTNNEEISENAVVIIGNGFDLAHGKKTSYNDFSNWYIKKNIAPELSKTLIGNHRNKGYESNYIDENFINEFYEFGSSLHIDNLNPFRDRFIDFIKNNYDNQDRNVLVNYLNKNHFEGMLVNKFLEKLYTNKYDNWFDIENAYCSELEQILSTDPKVTKS